MYILFLYIQCAQFFKKECVEFCKFFIIMYIKYIELCALNTQIFIEYS